MLRFDLNLVFTVINLLIWYALIRKFLFKPIDTVISKREEAITSRYAEADRLQKEAQTEKERCIAFEAEIEQEKIKAVEAAQVEARSEYDRIMKDAREKADQLLEGSRKEAALEKEKIVGRAEQEIRSLIMESAVRSMEKQPNDHALYDEFLIKAGETTYAEH
ncbi:MAG: ATP synthase F0 subunit B [Clostridiales bacterium]|nr:ATP synthase F0 subunit B [Clostridiales bacterium]